MPYQVRILGPINKGGVRDRLDTIDLDFDPVTANALDKITRACRHPRSLMIALHAARDYLVNNHEVMEASDVLNLETALALLNIDVPPLDGGNA